MPGREQRHRANDAETAETAAKRALGHPSIWLLVRNPVLPILPVLPPLWVVLIICSLWDILIIGRFRVVFGVDREVWVRRAEKNFSVPEIFVEVFFPR